MISRCIMFFTMLGGVFGYVFAAFAIVMCVLGVIFKMSPKYIVMMGLLEYFFFFLSNC